MPADFIVGLEVQPRGSGIRETARETRVLTEETRKNTEALRHSREIHEELERAERRRRATLEQMVQSIRANNLALAQARTDHAQYQQRVEAAAEAKRRATGVVNSFRAAIVALQVAVAALGLGALVRDSVNVALAFDRANKSLVAATGSQQAAGREMAFVSAEADRLGLVLKDAGQAYARLSAASRGTSLAGQQTRDIFSAIAESSTVLGLSAEETTGTLKALQDMISKGTVQAEELRGQLGDRLPGAFQLAARAMGVSTAELGKMLESGKVMAADLLPKLADELRKTFGPGLVNAVNSAQANLNRLRNMVDQVKGALGEGFLAGFLAGFADLKEALSAEELKAAARDLGESIGKALRTGTDLAVALAKNLELVKAVLLVLVGLKAAAWFVGLAGAIATATGATLTFKAALSSLAIAGPLAAIGVALLAVIVVMERYITTTRLAHEAEMAKVAKSQELFGYYQTLKSNKVGLTEAEAAYAVEVRKTMEAELAATRVSLERTKAQLQASMTLNPFKYAAVAGPGRNVLREQVAEQEREAKTLENQLNILDSQWKRLGKLPVIKLPVDTAQVDGAAKKVADLLTGFQRTAEQAERIRAAQASGGASEVARVTEEIERQNAAYQALHSVEGLSAAAKAKLSTIIEGLVGRTQDANRATAEGAAETARSLAFTASAIEAEARLADAKGQTSAASREAAVQAEADAIAREYQKENDAEYVAGLLQVIRVRHDYLASIALEVAAVERQIAHAATLRQKQAELADARAQDTAATRRLTVELEAETEARARGVQVGTIGYQLLLAIIATRAQEVAGLEQQTAAQRRLNEAEQQRARVRADFTDWLRQRDAVKAYGSEIAGILDSYGLLSEAAKELALQEQALAIFREEGGARAIEQIEAELRGYAAVEESLARVAAATELLAYRFEPVQQAVAQVGQMLQEAVIDQIIEGKVEVEDLAKTILRTMLSALAEMLKRWILTHKAMQAEAMKTAAVNAAAAQAGGGTGGFGNVGGGTGGMGSLFSMGSQAMGGGGAGMGGTAATLGWVAAIYVALYVGVSAWIKSHKEHIARVTFRLQEDVGGAVHDIHGNAANVKALTDQIQAAGKAVVDWLKSIGGAIESAGSVSVWREGQGKNTSWYVQVVGGVKEWFASQEEAFSFAMVQALKQAEISGLDPIVLAAIRNTTARTMEEFQAGVADAIKVAGFGQGGAGADFRAVSAEMDRLRASMREMIGTGAELADALGRINAQEILLLQSRRDAITGKQRTAEEEYQMRLLEARSWNAQREVRLAGIALDILAVKAKIADAEATRRLIRGGGEGGGEGGGGGLLGLGRTIMWLAGTVNLASTVMTESGDASLDALKAYLKSLEDLHAALAAIPPISDAEVPRGDGRRPGAGAGGDRGQGRLDLLEEVRGWKLGDVGRALRETSAWFEEFKKRIREMGFSAEQQAALMAAAAEELARRQKAIRDAQLQASSDFLTAGTAAGGPLARALQDNKKTQEQLIQGNRELYKGGQMSLREMRELNRAIREAGERQRDQMIGTASGQLFLDLYQLLGDEAAAAQLRYDLTLAELDLRREELRLAMEAAGWTRERMDAVLGPIGDLIDRVRAAGPGIFGPQGGSGGGGTDTGGQSTGSSGYFDSNGVWHPTWATGSNDNDPRIAARELLDQYRNAGRSEYAQAVAKVEGDFAAIRAALGDTQEVADLFAAAMGRLRAQFLEGVREFYDALRSGDLSGLNTEQRFGAAQAEYSRLLALVQGGDLSQANALAQAGQELVQLAGQMWGTSTGGYAELREAILAQLQQLLGIPGSPAAGASSGPGPSPGASPPGLGPQSSGGSGSAGAAPSSDRGVAATNKVAETVDLAGRKQEVLLRRIGDILEELKTLTREIRDENAKPDAMGYGNR